MQEQPIHNPNPNPKEVGNIPSTDTSKQCIEEETVLWNSVDIDNDLPIKFPRRYDFDDESACDLRYK